MYIKPKRSIVSFIVAIVLFVVILIAGIWYQVWQYQLCYPEVSTSFWYCWQHAFGN